TSLRLLTPEVLRKPVQTELFEGLRPGFAGLAVEADLGVPGVEHLFPLRPDSLPLRGAVHGGRAITRRWIFRGAGVPTAERGRAASRPSRCRSRNPWRGRRASRRRA